MADNSQETSERITFRYMAKTGPCKVKVRLEDLEAVSVMLPIRKKGEAFVRADDGQSIVITKRNTCYHIGSNYFRVASELSEKYSHAVHSYNRNVCRKWAQIMRQRILSAPKPSSSSSSFKVAQSSDGRSKYSASKPIKSSDGRSKYSASKSVKSSKGRSECSSSSASKIVKSSKGRSECSSSSASKIVKSSKGRSECSSSSASKIVKSSKGRSQCSSSYASKAAKVSTSSEPSLSRHNKTALKKGSLSVSTTRNINSEIQSRCIFKFSTLVKRSFIAPAYNGKDVSYDKEDSTEDGIEKQDAKLCHLSSGSMIVGTELNGPSPSEVIEAAESVAFVPIKKTSELIVTDTGKLGCSQAASNDPLSSSQVQQGKNYMNLESAIVICEGDSTEDRIEKQDADLCYLSSGLMTVGSEFNSSSPSEVKEAAEIVAFVPIKKTSELIVTNTGKLGCSQAASNDPLSSSQVQQGKNDMNLESAIVISEGDSTEDRIEKKDADLCYLSSGLMTVRSEFNSSSPSEVKEAAEIVAFVAIKKTSELIVTNTGKLGCSQAASNDPLSSSQVQQGKNNVNLESAIVISEVGSIGSAPPSGNLKKEFEPNDPYSSLADIRHTAVCSHVTISSIPCPTSSPRSLSSGVTFRGVSSPADSNSMGTVAPLVGSNGVGLPKLSSTIQSLNLSFRGISNYSPALCTFGTACYNSDAMAFSLPTNIMLQTSHNASMIDAVVTNPFQQPYSPFPPRVTLPTDKYGSSHSLHTPSPFVSPHWGELYQLPSNRESWRRRVGNGKVHINRKYARWTAKKSSNHFSGQ